MAHSWYVYNANLLRDMGSRKTPTETSVVLNEKPLPFTVLPDASPAITLSY